MCTQSCTLRVMFETPVRSVCAEMLKNQSLFSDLRLGVSSTVTVAGDAPDGCRASP